MAGAALYLGEEKLVGSRADHTLGPRARTPTIDALARSAVAFPNAFPEAMPTVPARNSILSGRRMFPFRGWHEYPGLVTKPGWEPPERLSDLFPAVLGRA